MAIGGDLMGAGAATSVGKNIVLFMLSGPDSYVALGDQHTIQALFSCVRKVFEMESLHIWSIKYRIITKLITELVCKLRDESNESN